MIRVDPQPRRILYAGASLAFIAGFADASTFVGAGGLFCAHVTGNFVVLAADLTRNVAADQWLKLSTFPVFAASVVGAAWLQRRLGADRPESTRALLLLKSLLFGAAAAIAVASPPERPGPARTAVVSLLVMAMGLQNAMHQLNPALGPVTTAMTGNVTHWLVDKVVPVSLQGAPQHRLIGVVMTSFALGCMAGGLGVAQFGFGVLLVPMAVALITHSLIR